MKHLKKVGSLFALASIGAFTLASCGEAANAGATEASKKIILMQDKQTGVTADFSVASIVKGDNGVTYSVAWTSSDTSVLAFGEADPTSKLQLADIKYDPALKATTTITLTATLTNPENEKDVATKTFSFEVPKFEASTIKDYDKAKKGDTITLKGVITARETFNKTKGNFYIQCEDGGFEAYGLTCTEDQFKNELKIGTTVFVTGSVATYNGLRELGSGCTYMLADDAAKTVTPTDITADFTAGKLPTTADQCKVVKLTGVTVVSNDGTSIVVGDANDTKKQLTVRKSNYLIDTVTDANSTTKNSITVANFAVGSKIDVVAVVGWYNNPQLAPMSIKASA